MSKPHFVPYSQYRSYPEEEMRTRSEHFLADMTRRRTVREFSDRPVSKEVIENCVKTALTAPSGANRQPWHFVIVTDPEIKKRIRLAAEKEEHEFYTKRAPQDWLDALAPLGTDEKKPYLETAPHLIVIFQQLYGLVPDGSKLKHYYATESVGLAAGFLIAAVHQVGLASLTHTPSPMGFLNEILGRPESEKAFLILVTGYPADDAKVPSITKKPFEQVVTWM